ncbi:MAG: hypothetical protein ACRCX4_11325 [Bacteroidales bacterium]
MKKRIFIFIAILLSVTFLSHANESRQTDMYPNKHEIRLSVSDGTPLNISNFLGTAIGDAITGTERDRIEICGIFGIGYRYAISRWKVGGDIGFASLTNRVKSSFYGSMTRNTESNIHFLILPTGELTYFKRKKVTLYSSAAIGAILSRSSYSSDYFFENRFIENSFNYSDFYATFAFQVNPIAIRVGNERIGGFMELGVGYKGFISAGISILF